MKNRLITVNRISSETFADTSCVSLGLIPDSVLKILQSHAPQIISRIHSQEVLLWSNRIEHIERHKNDFLSDKFYEICLEDMPEFIRDPDCISIKSDGSSISFIKKLSQNVSVAVRVSTGGKLSVRTMYPIMDIQLEAYLKHGTAWNLK